MTTAIPSPSPPQKEEKAGMRRPQGSGGNSLKVRRSMFLEFIERAGVRASVNVVKAYVRTTVAPFCSREDRASSRRLLRVKIKALAPVN